MDNRVLPPHVDEELAKKEGEWTGGLRLGRGRACMWLLMLCEGPAAA